jgi:hypothetical protein
MHQKSPYGLNILKKTHGAYHSKLQNILKKYVECGFCKIVFKLCI